MPSTSTSTTTTTTSTTTTSILRQSTSVLLLSLPSFLLLSLLLLFLRTSLLAGALRLSSLPDTNPLLRSLLSRLSSPNSQPPFFHLSPSLPFPDPPFFSPSPPLSHFPSPNSSLFLNSTSTVRVTVPTNILFSLSDSNSSQSQHNFSLREDGLQLLHFLSLLSSALAAAILAFMLSYSTAYGVVFYCVATTTLSRPAPSLTDVICCGAKLGVSRVDKSVFLKWAVRDVIVQLLSIFFFADVEDRNELFRLFVRVRLMPFSLTVDEGGGMMPGFLIAWWVLDFGVSLSMVFVPWIDVVDGGRRTGREVVREGVFFVSLVGMRCVWIKCLEVGLCGRLGRWVLGAIGGRRFAMWTQGVFEVYFMVVWLVLYLEGRRKEFELGGRRFGREDLERCVDGI